ncbi:kinase-like domain-containing protein [Fimicolochytrium jonesii]|uniref:kinase-like domain-containing protein n=1 Tax=Fimicolochytrium jonesii TaxID=1396493 RepID=UPI0022FEA926|nr:kinase-like domain-containing protein [Fimicolochytrium jonesii]KAI8818964.1 kinase-like domain-containing protein [Fimicolochytrium jonesii]
MASTESKVVKKTALQEKLGALRGAFSKKGSSSSEIVSPDDDMNHSLPSPTSPGGQGKYVTNNLPALPTRASDTTLAASGQRSSKPASSAQGYQMYSISSGASQSSTDVYNSGSSSLPRQTTNLTKGKMAHGSMPLGTERLKIPAGGKAISEDTGSEEELDQISELKLNSPTAASSAMLSGQRSGSVDTLNAQAGTPADSSLGSQSGGAKHHKSLPKITTLFMPKKNRASSATPGCDSGLMSPVSPSIGNLPLTQNSRKGTLSAYEMGPNAAPGLHRDYNLDDFHIVRRVGKGGFANVFLVRLKHSTGRYYALKAIKKHDVVKMKQDKQVMNEKNILRNIDHPFIVELYHTFQNPTYLFMTMEYVAGGDLFSYLRKAQRFSEEASRFYVSEVLISLEYLHTNKIIYRDLKPENILLDTTGHVKLADFGFAKVVNKTTQSFCGTPDYISVEIVVNKPYTKAVDWWSLGVLVYELISGKTPFGDESSDRIYDNIQSGRIKWHPLIKGHAKELIRRLLDIDPEKRLGSNGDGAEIKQHPWFKPVIWKKAEARQTVPPFVPPCQAPEVIEQDGVARGVKSDEYMEALKSPVSTNGFFRPDPFVELFKDF